MSSFESSRLSWNWKKPNRATLRKLYQALIALRKAHPEFGDGTNRGRVELQCKEGDHILLMERGRFQCWFNLSERERDFPDGEIVWRSEDDASIWQALETLVVEPG